MRNLVSETKVKRRLDEVKPIHKTIGDFYKDIQIGGDKPRAYAFKNNTELL